MTFRFSGRNRCVCGRNGAPAGVGLSPAGRAAKPFVGLGVGDLRLSSVRDKFVAFAFCWADVLIEVDQSRRILFAAGATKVLLGAKPEELIGQNFTSLVDPKDRVLADQLMAMSSKHGR